MDTRCDACGRTFDADAEDYASAEADGPQFRNGTTLVCCGDCVDELGTLILDVEAGIFRSSAN